MLKRTLGGRQLEVSDGYRAMNDRDVLKLQIEP
jgi:hypothetical protein